MTREPGLARAQPVSTADSASPGWGPRWLQAQRQEGGGDFLSLPFLSLQLEGTLDEECHRPARLSGNQPFSVPCMKRQLKQELKSHRII